MSMAIFSPKLPSLAPPHGSFTSRPYLLLRPMKTPRFHFGVLADNNGSGLAATVPEETMGSNGSPPLPAEAAMETESVAEAVSKFKDARWVGGTWDLKQFEKDGKTHWDSLIDAEVKRRKWMEDNPQSSSNEEPIIFDTSIIPWWSWIKRFHLPEAELLNGRAAMVGFFMAYFVDSLTGVGLVDQMGNLFCKTLLFVAVAGVLLVRKNEDIDKLKKLVDESTFYDKQWQATWKDDTSSKN